MDYNELYHYGVKGQKWGVRRYQNKDGSLTAAGKKRVNGGGDTDSSEEKKESFGWSDMVSRTVNRMKKLSGRSEISADDRADFDWDVEGTEEMYSWNHPALSSKKTDDVKKIAKELNDYYDDNIKRCRDEGDQVNADRLVEYKKTYLKDSEEYAKAVIDTINEYETLRRKDGWSLWKDDELQHWGIKGQKWGQRRFQNPDGSLTPRGKERYNKEVEKLKAEEAKIKAAEKVAKTKARTQAKLDKLDAKKAELEERKKKLKNGDVEDPDKKVETDAERKARALKSTDPKEVYANKDLLSYNELNERVNRIDLETRLQNKIPADPKEPTIMDRVDKTKNAIDKATGLYKSVDSAFSTVANSYIGKTLAETLDIKLPKKEAKPFDAKEFWENRHKKSSKEMKDAENWLKSEKSIKDNLFGTGDKAANGKGSNIDMDKIQSLVDDAVENAMRERED